MKCWHCGTVDVRVLETRRKDVHVRRRYECGNGHRFTSFEVYPTVLSRLTEPLPEILAAAANGVQDRARIFHLRRAIKARLDSGAKVAEIARDTGVHRVSIYRHIRAMSKTD